jgi:Tfp pilus assembly protein PilW
MSKASVRASKKDHNKSSGRAAAYCGGSFNCESAVQLSSKKAPYYEIQKGSSAGEALQMVACDLKANSKTYSGSSGNKTSTMSDMSGTSVGSKNFKEIYQSQLTKPSNTATTEFDCSEPHALSQLIADFKTDNRRLPYALAQAKMDQAKVESRDSHNPQTDKNGVRKRCGWCRQWLPKGEWRKSHINHSLVKAVKDEIVKSRNR